MTQVLASLKNLFAVSSASSVAAIALLVACGPTSRTGPGDDVDAPPVGTSDAPGGPCVAAPEAAACGDMVDNDCDGITDCRDPDCSGVGACPVCGVVSRPLGAPFALPDGDGTSYTSALNFTGFGANQTMTMASDLQYVCAKMEHSWIRDLQINLLAPDGQKVELNKFLGQSGGQVFLGEPNDNDEGGAPIPGVGYRYCWTMDATRPSMLEFANANPSITTLPATNFKPATPFADLIGTKFNGAWKIEVIDLWGIDNGFIFEWTIAFNPALLTECPPPIE
ncbi:MAG: hypothetical protein KBG15_24820 [Kofleriaceae bacterium]|nr:hypothetical protein [Kofleriaceae bacterium]